jgi:hypothetical protein
MSGSLEVDLSGAHLASNDPGKCRLIVILRRAARNGLLLRIAQLIFIHRR